MPRLLLLSNSLNPGGEYLAHARDAIAALAGPRALFVPYAGVRIDHDAYADRVAEALAPAGVEVRSIHRAADPRRAAAEADAVLVGGGNTFALLDALHAHGLVAVLRERARAGMPYVGWSAGTNVACPTIRTTNDMPIVEPPSLAALGLVPFQVNPHYTDARLPDHGGETREERLLEFVARNPAVPVVGLPEGSFLRIVGRQCRLEGPHGARLFRHGQPIAELAAGSDLSSLLDVQDPPAPVVPI